MSDTESILRVNHVNVGNARGDRDVEIVDATPVGNQDDTLVRRVNFNAPAGTYRVNDQVRVTVELLT